MTVELSANEFEQYQSEIIRVKLRNEKNFRIQIWFCILSYFPIIYFLAYLGIIDASMTLILNIIGSVLGKLLYSVSIIESHINILDDITISCSDFKSKIIQKMALTNDQDLRNMIGNVAHDLKTVLLLILL